MFALGLGAVAVALLVLLAEARLTTKRLIAAGAALAFLCGLSLLVIGAAAGLVAVLAVSPGLCVAAVGGVALLRRSLDPATRLSPWWRRSRPRP